MVALGLTLIFGVMRILNIAHGSLYAWGGYFAATLGLLGTVLEFALLRRILDKDPILQLLVTFAAFMVLEDLQRMIWGAPRWVARSRPSPITGRWRPPWASTPGASPG
ncbi:hypothetical protein [Rhodoferax sp.]|uniref:ABC transporter permease subunit n=1 Tax=Rhodoferax sp. TaxID=50421 RepID=UPI0025FDB403|nr:hypothetical protein [Rhodoferax sp.]MCM2341011.1 hypothetical protein [Rhodoferax sp.]